MTRETFTVACCALALALGAAAEEQGRLVGVRARADAKASTVEIDGDRPLSFTTMKLLSPPRVVVDFADTDVAAEPRELEIEDGTLRRAAVAQAGSRTARVVIELAVDAEFDVRAEGNRVEVRVPRPGAVAEAEPHGEGAGDAEAEKVASLPKVSLVGSKPAQPPEDGRTDRQRTAAEKAEALKKTLAEQRKREAEEKAARKLALKNGRKVGPRAAPKPPPEPAAQVDRAVPQSSPDPAAKVERPVAEPSPEGAAKLERAPQVTPPTPAAKLETPQPETAPAPPPAVAEKPPEQAPARPKTRAAMAGERHITGIGFRPIQGGEVIVRSDHPLEYGVSDDAGAVLLHLPSAAIPLPNNRRPLDTRFFHGAVERVIPMPVPGGTDVRIELRQHAEYQLAQNGSVLTVTFAAVQ
ncbi:MAG: AMIN domain-containing protein [Deltaproteobacteria bacterium]|nr:MAG: AMIN domain-containing protein [Deltaproteobacteria bacterium]